MALTDGEPVRITVTEQHNEVETYYVAEAETEPIKRVGRTIYEALEKLLFMYPLLFNADIHIKEEPE